MIKQQLRKHYLAKRIELTEDSYANLNRQLLEQFKLLNLNSVGCMHVFLPMVARKEPDTLLLINWLKTEQPQIKLAYPKTNFVDYTILNFADDTDLKLEVNAMGITEPISGNIVEINQIDLVIVPLLVFDKKGYRVGYGKGFYDRFMATCKPGTRFVGLSFFEAIDTIEDIDQYDIPLQQCITPGKIWHFN